MESMTKQVEECLESSDCYGGWNLKEQHREDFESTNINSNADSNLYEQVENGARIIEVINAARENAKRKYQFFSQFQEYVSDGCDSEDGYYIEDKTYGYNLDLHNAVKRTANMITKRLKLILPSTIEIKNGFLINHLCDEDFNPSDALSIFEEYDSEKNKSEGCNSKSMYLFILLLETMYYGDRSPNEKVKAVKQIYDAKATINGKTQEVYWDKIDENDKCDIWKCLFELARDYPTVWPLKATDLADIAKTMGIYDKIYYYIIK